MDVRRIVTGVLLMVLLLVGLSIAVPQTSQAAAAKDSDAKTMWCNIPNEQFYSLCNDKQFMQSLTPEQKKAIDIEWQRRVPNMTPAERDKYYPAGQRYYPGG